MADDGEFDSTIIAISEKDARAILTNQVTTINHLQSQGLGTLRVVFAVIAILATVAITGIDYPVSPFESQYTATRVNSTLDTTNISALKIGGSIVGSVFMFISSSLIAGLLLIHGFSKLYSLISPTQLQPGLGTSSHIVPENVKEIYKSIDSSAQILEHDQWISYNANLIKRNQKLLSTGVADVYASGIIAGFSLLVLQSAYSVITLNMLLMSTTAPLLTLLTGLLVAGWTIRVYRKQDKTVRESIAIARDEIYEVFLPVSYTGWGSAMKISVGFLFGVILISNSAVLFLWFGFLL